MKSGRRAGAGAWGARQLTSEWSSSTRRFFLCSSWVPPVLWMVTLLFLRGYDGWGAWAAAPLLVPSLALSAVWGSLGVLLLGHTAVRDRRLDYAALAATLVSGAAVFYYLGRHLVRSAG